MKWVTREEMAEIDRKAIHEYGISALVLMGKAGRAVADEVVRVAKPGTSVAVVCGKGHNGGDGFACARHLRSKELEPQVFLIGEIERVKGDARFHLDELLDAKVPVVAVVGEKELVSVQKAFRKASVLVDGIFGTGLNREVQGLEKMIIQLMNASGKPIIAIDTPSGLDCNEGVPLGTCVKAVKTVTMGLPKVGFRKQGAQSYTGEVVVADIGFPKELLCS